MTKISNQYSLTNVLFADAVNGRVGIGTASPTVALDVVGAGKFSGALTATNAILGNVINNTNSIQINGINSTFSHLGTAFGATFISNNTFFNGSAYAFDDNTKPNAQITLSAGIISLSTSPANTDVLSRVTVTSAGNVGIGNTYELGLGYLSLTLGGSKPGIFVIKDNAGNDKGYVYTNISTSFFTIESAGANPLLLSTNSGERMRITSGGNVLIGTTSALDKFVVNGGVRTTGTASGNFFDDRSSTNFFGWYAQGGQPFFFNGAVGNIASINPSNGVYTPLSDVNKKKDFEQSNIGLKEVLQLKPTLYRMKTDDGLSAKELGFIAQEVKELIPQAYSESGEGDDKFIGLNQMPLIAALTKSIQEQQLQINELKALLNAH